MTTTQQINQIRWMRGLLRWKLHAAQKLIYDKIRALPQSQREALIFCSRRFGKSYLGIILALEDAIRNPGKQVAIVGPSFKQTKAIVTPILKDILKDAPKGLVTQSKSTSTWNISNGSSLILGGFDTIAESFRGLDIFSLYLEETGSATADLDEYSYLLYSILFPTLMHSRGRIHHLTTPSRIVDHPLHIETLPKCKLSDAFYLFTIEDNPLLTKEDIEAEIELLGGRDSVSTQRELFCQIKRDDSITVVTTFDESRHVQAITPSHPLKYNAGGDLGYTNDLSVFLLAGYDHNIGKVLVLDELSFAPETPSSKIVETLHKTWQQKPTYIADIQGNTRIDMATLGLDAYEPVKDKFDSTITFIRNEFYNDRLIIDPKCKLLIETLRSATFNKQKTDFLRTATLGHADALMALVYLLRSIDRHTDLRPKPRRSTHFFHPDPPHPLTKLG